MDHSVAGSTRPQLDTIERSRASDRGGLHRRAVRRSSRPQLEALDRRVLLATTGDLVASYPGVLGGLGPVVAQAPETISVAQTPADELIVNGGFETGDFTGWTTNIRSTGGTGDPLEPWTVSGAGAGSGFGLAPTAPQGGQFIAWNGFDGGGPMEFTLAQDVAIPGGATAQLSWVDRAQWIFEGFGGVATLPRTYQVQVRDAVSNALRATVFSFSTGTEATNPRGDTGFVTHTADLSAFAGSLARIVFLETVPEDFTGPAQIEFDNISVIATGAPTGRLDPASDTGVSATDSITTDVTPTFIGTALPGATVSLTAFPGLGPGLFGPIPLGQTVTAPDGTWRLTSVPLDVGTYRVFARVVNPDGRVATITIAPPSFPLVIASAAPQIQTINLQPRLGRLLVTYADPVAGIDLATLGNAADVALVRLRAPGRPPLVVTSVTVSPSSPFNAPQTVAFTFDGGRQLPRGLYGLTIGAGTVTNNIGLALDGEFRGTFPTGNGAPGGDFNGVLLVGTDGVFFGLPRPLGGFFTPPNRTPRSVVLRTRPAPLRPRP